MRFSFKHQIMLPLAGVLLVAILTISGLHSWLAGQRAQRHVEGQLRRVCDTLASSTFPLTTSVLTQMKGLSGADFVVATPDSTIRAGSRELPADVTLPPANDDRPRDRLADWDLAEVDGRQFFHTALQLSGGEESRAGAYLHVLYPQIEFHGAWWEAALPPAVAGLVGLGLVLAAGQLVATRVTRPIHSLQKEVHRIGSGDFNPVPLPARDDELADLAKSINHMAAMLVRFEENVRRNEQLRTLGQLGGGIAHQLRNSVTGCRLALDLHHRECPLDDAEGLAVARRELALVHEYLDRFLALGHREERPLKEVRLDEVVEDALLLVRLRARHLGVELAWSPPGELPAVMGDTRALGQLVVNLVINAIDAAVESADVAPNAATACIVRIETHHEARANVVQLRVLDSGSGPSPSVTETLFDPLVSTKPDGAGLGLAVVHQIAIRHGGKVTWQRAGSMTCFCVELPACFREATHDKDRPRRVAHVGRG